MNAFTCLLEDINLDCHSLGGMKRENCRLTNLQVFQILVLFPFFAIKGYSHYAGSALSRMFGGKKDMFYSYLPQDNINWRKVIYRITDRLVKRVVIRDDHKKSKYTAICPAKSLHWFFPSFRFGFISLKPQYPNAWHKSHRHA